MNPSWPLYTLLLLLPLWTSFALLLSPAPRDRHVALALWTCVCWLGMSAFLLSTGLFFAYELKILMALYLLFGMTVPRNFATLIYPEFFMMSFLTIGIIAPYKWLCILALQGFFYTGFVWHSTIQKSSLNNFLYINTILFLLWSRIVVESSGIALSLPFGLTIDYVSQFFWAVGVLMLCPINFFSSFWEHFFLKSALRWKSVGMVALWGVVLGLERQWPTLSLVPFSWILQGILCSYFFRLIFIRPVSWETLQSQWGEILGTLMLATLFNAPRNLDFLSLLQYGLTFQILTLLKPAHSIFSSFSFSATTVRWLPYTLFAGSIPLIFRAVQYWPEGAVFPKWVIGILASSVCFSCAIHVKILLKLGGYDQKTSLGILIFLAGAWAWSILSFATAFISM